MAFETQQKESNSRFPGVYSGQVEDVNDPQKVGRIRVSIPAIFASSSPESWVWARPCLPYGLFFMPNVKDQVWLAFENGNPRNPVWLGTWYAAGTVPPEAVKSPPLNRVIRTSTGNMVEINDHDQRIVIRDVAGNTVTLDSEGITLIDYSKNQLKVDSLKTWLGGLLDVFLTEWMPPPGAPDSGAALKAKLGDFFAEHPLPM
jgi:hypothetical protein